MFGTKNDRWVVAIGVLVSLAGILGAMRGQGDPNRQLTMADNSHRTLLFASLPGAVEASEFGRYLDPAALDDARSGVESLRERQQTLFESDVVGCALTSAWAIESDGQYTVFGEFDDSKTCVTDFVYRAFFLIDP